MVLSVSHGKLFAVALLFLPGRAVEGTTLTRASPMQSAASGAHCRATELSVKSSEWPYMTAMYCLYTSRWPSGIRYTFITGNRRCRFSGGSAKPHHHQPDAHRTCRLAAGFFQSCAVAASTRTGGCSQPRATGYDKHLVAGRRCPERSSQTTACGAIFGRRLGDVGALQKHMCLSDLKGSSTRDIDSYAGALQSTP